MSTGTAVMNKMVKFNIKDLRNEKVFPNLDYRYSRLNIGTDVVILERDYLGENPLHYYLEISNDELIIANNIVTWINT